MDADMNDPQKGGSRFSVEVGNAANETYEAALRRIEARKECPFCENNLAKEHSQAILRKGAFWILTRNQFGYEEAEERFLLISIPHAEKLADLPPEAASEAWELLQYLEKEHQVSYGAFALRFGDPAYTGATVRHLHFHCLKPRPPHATDYQPIRFRIGGRTNTPS